MQFFFQIPQNLVYMVKILFLNKLRYISNARATHSGVSRGKTVVLATATGNHLPIAESQTRFCRHYRAENLCYQSGHGQKLLPQFRKIIGLVLSIGWDTHTRFYAVVLATATGNHLPIAESQTRFCRHYRAENLCYQSGRG